jgi:hypothetical protein
LNRDPRLVSSGAAVPAVYTGVSPAVNSREKRPGDRRDARNACSTTPLLFVESPHDFDAVHWDHEPFRGTPLVWSPAFRRFGPAKAGTPNGRFVESPLSLFRMHWDHEPFRGTPLVWSPAFRRFGPAKAGTPNGRFVESLHVIFGAHWLDKP